MLIDSGSCEALIDATGTGSFSHVLLETARGLAGVDEIFAYWVDDRSAPASLISSGLVGSSQSRADRYTREFFAFDPLLPLAYDQGHGTQMARLAVGDVADATYRRECYERPGFAEKLAFAQHRRGRHFVLNFYRGHASPVLRPEALADLAEIALPLLRKHLDITGDESDMPLVMRLERRLARAFPRLSRRELQVCARTLHGMTAEAISLDLAVSEATVLTYRRRAYERYHLSSSHEMIGRILF